MQKNTEYQFELAGGASLRSVLHDTAVDVQLDGVPALQLALGAREGSTRRGAIVAWPAVDTQGQRRALLAALHAVFAADAEVAALQLDFSDHRDALPALLRQGLAVAGPDGRTLMPRDGLVQQPELWLQGDSSAGYPLAYMVSNGKRHPRRPPRPPISAGTVYQRFIPWLGQYFSLRTLDAEADLAVFHAWMNHPRVARFWEEQGDLDKHRAFIANALADPHVHPLVGCLDGKPFAYFEAYWAKEDRIAPFYPVGDHDRGIHMLVGEDWARGPQFVAAWLPSLAHYLMLDDPRTQAVVCEPRADNARMIGYLQQHGFAYLRQFDFPHKRAALLVLEREVHAQGRWLGAAAQ